MMGGKITLYMYIYRDKAPPANDKQSQLFRPAKQKKKKKENEKRRHGGGERIGNGMARKSWVGK